jgi:hypothetical protein
MNAKENDITPTDGSLYVQQWANTIIDPETGASMEYRHFIKHPKYSNIWSTSFSNEIGRLAQGVGGRIKGIDTINFIEYNKVPIDRWKDVTYGNIVVDYRPQKEEENRTRLTVGGNLIDFPGEVSTPTADITTTKLVINSTVSTPNAKYMCGDIKHFYLGVPMERKEYMRLPISVIPEEMIGENNLAHLVYKGFVYIEICKGMYGLPKAGILANQLLTKRLALMGTTNVDIHQDYGVTNDDQYSFSWSSTTLESNTSGANTSII